MAKKDKKKVSKIKIKKKAWYKVLSPKIFGNKDVGESYLQSPEKAIGRKLTSNLKDLTGNVKDQNVMIGMQINKVDGSTLRTTIVSYQLTPAYVKRVVRKNTAKVEDYYILKTKSGKEVIIKTLVVTINKVQRSVRTTLRKEFKEFLQAELEKTDLSTFVSMLVNRRIQNEAKRKLKKIFPSKEVSIRMLKLKEKGIVEEEIIVVDKAPAKKEESKVEEAPKVEAKVEETIPKTEEKPVVEEAKVEEESKTEEVEAKETEDTEKKEE
jgi:small subunit ribosomal protein S3Ae